MDFEKIMENAENACDESNEWLSKQPRSMDDLLSEHPDWALWAAGKIDLPLKPGMLDACAEEWPWVALRFAAPLLTPEMLDECASKWPSTALEYAASLLTPERLKECKKMS